MDIVIIGNSAAAVGCIEGIRQSDKESSITVISKEPYPTYSRPLISYLLYGKTTEQGMLYRPESFYRDNHVTFMAGKTVKAIHKDEKNVLLEDGSLIKYDKLLIATGSTPFIPPIQGLDTVPYQSTFLSLDDAKFIQAAVTPETRVLIMGAGLIGLKCAEGIQRLVKSITVVDLADRILPSILDEQGSDLVKAHMEEHGITFILSDSVTRFEENRAYLSSGRTVDFDLLVIAVGVRPNVELAKDIGIHVGRGIQVDADGRTSQPDIYAAGDCTESFDITSGERRVLALLPAAYMQGESAGIHMVGGEKPYDKAIPMNAIGFFGLHMITAGSYDGESYIESGTGTYKRLVTKDGLLKGYILIGDVARAGIYTAMIRNQVPLDTVDFDLLREKPQLMAFSRKDREEMLGREPK